MKKTVLVIGGGAAGLAAAITAAEHSRVILLERMDRVGKKLLSTGNGRCNLTNLHISPDCYRTDQQALLADALAGMTPQAVLAFFQRLGLFCVEEADGRMYPITYQASTVLDVLLLALERKGIEVHCGAAVCEMKKGGSGWVAKTVGGEAYRGDAVVLTCGGRAAPKLGSDGSGFSLAKKLGHSCTPLFPALVALTCDMRQAGGLKGVRAHGNARLLAGEQCIAEDGGELQFTEYGLSGIPILQLSAAVGRDHKAPLRVELDLFPHWSRAQLLEELCARARRHPETPLELFLTGLLHKRLAFAAMKQCGLSPLSAPLGNMDGERIAHLAELLKGWSFAVTGNRGYDNAQVTGGGIPLTEIDLRTMASRRCPDLFLAGEILDVTGLCGGFNLHWAWSSGIRAGTFAAREEKP